MTAGLRALIIWISTAAILGLALVVISVTTSPLDDPRAAQQRPGYLDAVGDRVPAPLVTISRPAQGRSMVIFFVRTAQQRPLLSALAKPDVLPSSVDVAVVGGRAELTEGRVASVTDVDGTLARGYDMPAPRDGGYPVGYAVVGPDRTIRYRTLDPQVAGRLDEVRTILAALM